MACTHDQPETSADIGRAAWCSALLATLVIFGCDADATDSTPFADSLEPPRANLFPEYHLDARHQGISPPETFVAGDLSLAWKTPAMAIGTYSASKSSPAIDEDRVFVGLDDGKLYALDRADGSVVWSFQTHRADVEARAEPDDNNFGIHGTPAFDDERVYIGDYSGYLYAVDKQTGALVWEEKLGGSIGASPALHGEHVFIAVEYPAPNGRVFVLNVHDGAERYVTPFMGDHPHSSASIDPERGYLFVGANNGIFFAFDYINGEEVWRYKTGADIKSTAAVARDTVYITSWDHELYAFDIDTGERRWSFASGDLSMSSPSIYDSVVYFGSHDGKLYAVDAEDGTEKWAFSTGGVIASSPTVVQETGVVIVGSKDRSLYIIDMADGSKLWEMQLDGLVSSVPVAAGNSLFVADDSGTIWAFDSP